jgi:hypothetical protein
MMFDKTINAVEMALKRNALPEVFAKTIREAHLFCFRDHDEILNGYEQVLKDNPDGGFRYRSDETYSVAMPFPVVAIDYGKSCVIINGPDRIVIAGCCIPGKVPPEVEQAAKCKLKDDATVLWVRRNSEDYNISKAAYSAIIYGENAETSEKIGFYIESANAPPKHMLNDFSIGVAAINLIMSPRRFVVEKKSARSARRPKKFKGVTQRSDRRPIYTSMTIRQIAEVIPIDRSLISSPGKKRCPHFRRGHTRTYRSDRYKFMKGKTQFIEPLWIGPRKAQKGKHIYRVIVDV